MSREPSKVVLNASCGPVRGNIYNHGGSLVDGYLGIPYAKPPIGELRFKKPVEADVWTEPRDCFEYGLTCPQAGIYANMLDGKVKYGEDNCLTLNVFVSKTLSSEFGNKRPVMVYIHGGGFEMGSSANTDDIAISGVLPLKDVVLVSINYRVGPLGFLNTGDDCCPGNFGLWDQTMALKWVQKHIESFGGDPGNVTVFGTSAGGMSSDYLALSPHSRDLFHKLIAMSGAAYSDLVIRTSEEQVKVFNEFARHHGYNGTDPESLLEWYKNQPVEKFADVSNFKMSASGFLIFLPTVNGEFFPKPFEELRAEGVQKKVMVTVGEYEGLGMLGNLKWSDGLPELQKAVEHVYGADVVRDAEKAQREIQTLYTDNRDEKTKILKCIEFFGDSWFNLPALQTVTSATRCGQDAYLASFDYFDAHDMPDVFKESLPFLSSTHGTDLPFVLGDGGFMKFHPNQTDLKVMDKVTTMYTDFAKYGNPNGHNTVEWEKYDLKCPNDYFKIDFPECKMEENFQNGRLQLLESILKKYKKW